MADDAPVTRKEFTTILDELRSEFRSFRQELTDFRNEFVTFKTNIETDLKKLSKDFYSFKKYTENYIRRDSVIIENELNETLSEHIHDLHPGYTIKRYDGVVKSIKKPHVYGQKLTEFDGLYVLVPKSPLPSGTGAASTATAGPKRHLIILEAKKYVDTSKIDEKLRQWRAIREIIRLSQNPSELARTQPAFQQTAKMLKFDDIGDVYLYIGGLDWAPGAHEKLKAEQKAELAETAEKKSTIGYVYLSGRRYDVADKMKIKPYPRASRTGGTRIQAAASDPTVTTTSYLVNIHGVKRI